MHGWMDGGREGGKEGWCMDGWNLEMVRNTYNKLCTDGWWVGWWVDGCMMDGWWMDGWIILGMGGARIEVPPSKGASCAFIFAGLFTEKDTWILWNIEVRSDMAQESMWNIWLPSGYRTSPHCLLGNFVSVSNKPDLFSILRGGGCSCIKRQHYGKKNLNGFSWNFWNMSGHDTSNNW